jgi:uncharacterized lipoprotein YmbA
MTVSCGRSVWPTVVVFALVALVLGCSARGLTVREYVLTPVRTQAAAPAGTRDLVVGVGPVSLPEYLRRPQIVTREGDNLMQPSDVHRWAGDLDGGVARVLAQNLTALIPSHKVSTFPWMNPTELDYRVAVRVAGFERGTDGNVRLEASWTLASGPRGGAITARVSDISQPAGGDDYGTIVNAMSQALGDLSREIATAIRQQAAARP